MANIANWIKLQIYLKLRLRKNNRHSLDERKYLKDMNVMMVQLKPTLLKERAITL